MGKASAADKTWDFTTASDYDFDNAKIEFSSGQAQLKSTSSPDWYNSNWKYRKEITIDNTGNSNTLSNYQVNVSLTGSNFDWSKALTNGEDIKFTDSDGITELDSWIETYTTNNGNIWVKIPTISASSIKKIYLYYGLNTAPNLKGGIITDIHGVTDSGTKLGSHAIANIGSFVTRMNSTIMPDFTVDMGDNINNANHDTDITNLGTIKTAFASLTNYSNHYYTLGNHDWTNITKAEYETALGIDYTQKSVDVGNYHIIVLDAGLAGQQNNGTGDISSDELSWLTTELANTNKKTIVFVHQGLGDQSVALNKYFSATPAYAKVDNSAAVRTILENSGKVIAVFQGHTHWDNNTTINGIPYIYLNSLVEDNPNEWAEIAIYNNQLLNVVFRQNGTTKNFLVWDFINKKWFNKGGQVFSLFDNFDGDSGQWSVLAGSAANHWDIEQGGGYLTENNGTSGIMPGRLLKSTYSEIPNYIVQAKIKTNTSNNSTGGFLTRLTNINNFNALYVNSNAGTNFRWKQMNASVWGLINEVNTYTPDTNWHTLKLLKVGTTNTLYYDGTNVLSASSNNLSDAYFGLWNYNAPIFYDNLYIRSYTTPEPTNSVGSESTIYDTSNPSVNPKSSVAQTFTSLSGFSENTTKNGGQIKYQISNDSGTTWYWYNSGWTTTTSGYTEANTASDINTNISTFPVGSGSFLFKAYLNSDGTQLVKLDSIDLAYANDTDYLISFSVASAQSNDENTDENNNNERDLNVHSVKAESTENSITLIWKTDHNTKSTIRYGTDRNLKEKKKDSQKEKEHKVILKDLLPNTKYYFRIKATDSDDNEDSSSIHSIMTKPVPVPSSNSSSSENSNQTPAPTENTATPSYSGNSSPNVCAYTVQSGDTLWSIAKKVYGDATAYTLIIDKNKDKYTDIESKLSIGQELTFCDNGRSSQTTGNSSNTDKSSQSSQVQIQIEPQTSTFHWWNPLSWF